MPDIGYFTEIDFTEIEVNGVMTPAIVIPGWGHYNAIYDRLEAVGLPGNYLAAYLAWGERHDGESYLRIAQPYDPGSFVASVGWAPRLIKSVKPPVQEDTMSDTTDTAPDTARAEAKAKRYGIIEGMISMGESFSEHLDAMTREIEGILDDLREVAGRADAGETKTPGDEPDAAEPESVCDGDVRTEGVWRDDVEIDPEMAKVIEAVERDNPGKTSHLGSGKGEGDPIDFDSDPALSEMAEATRRADDEATGMQVAEVPVDADEARTASALRLGHSLGMWGAIPIQKVRDGEVLPDVFRDEHLFRVENTILPNVMGDAKGAGYEVEIYKPGKFTSDVRVHRPATSSRVNHKNACPECGSLAIATRITDLTSGGTMRVCYGCDHTWPRF